MTDPTKLGVIQGGRKEPCLYCGKAPHPTALACPRILAIDIDPELGVVVAITFRDMPEDPPAAA